jgi:hypothetical protein
VEANRGQFFTANRFPVVKVMSRAALRKSVLHPCPRIKSIPRKMKENLAD